LFFLKKKGWWNMAQCACGKPLSNDPTDNKKIDDKVVCEDCYSKVMDAEIEHRGIVSPGHCGPGGAH
jgi:hypothetical protein